MDGVHPDLGELGPELRRLAQVILDTVDPAIRAAASRAATGTPGACQQVWCPVCALAAVVSGEEHPLLTVVAEHSVALLTVIRAMIDQTDGAAAAENRATDPPEGSAPPSEEAASPSAGDGDGPDRVGEPAPANGYQRIPVTVEE